MGIVNQIRSYGETLGDQQVIKKILRSLPNTFDSRVMAIEESKDLSLLSIDELMGSLLSHEQRLNRSRTSSLENYLLHINPILCILDIATIVVNQDKSRVVYFHITSTFISLL